MADQHEAIHTWFSLSYANYLVLPRSVLQSMPDNWQQRFVACLEELQQAAWDLPSPTYDVRVLKREPEFTSSDCESCEGEGEIERESEDLPGPPMKRCPACEGTGDGEPRYETPDEVGFTQDPIPHYNRGRTRVDLAAPREPRA